MSELWDIQNQYYDKGYRLICGVDEAGRGPLAGPVCAGAVILPQNLDIPGLKDSKKLSEKRREELYELITQQSIAWCAAFASVEEIEGLNILQATYLAMGRAIRGLSTAPDFALIDGNRAQDMPVPFDLIIKGDAKVASISAASIIAKVTRDRYMTELGAKYPQYGFEIHKGYGTKRHYMAILEHGPCEIHRMSFLKNLEQKRQDLYGQE